MSGSWLNLLMSAVAPHWVFACAAGKLPWSDSTVQEDAAEMLSGANEALPRQRIYSVQVFERLDDRMLPTIRIPSRDQDGAIERANEVAGMFGAAAAVCVTTDAADRMRTTILTKVGPVPDAVWDDSLFVE